MQPIARRLLPLLRPVAGQAGPLPSYLLFGTALGIEGDEPLDAGIARVRRGRRLSVPLSEPETAPCPS